MALPLMKTASSADDLLIADIAKFYADPLGFVMYAFPWGTGELEGRQPDAWQINFLRDVGNEVALRGFDGFSAVDPINFATSSGHGIGKSAITAWLILWIMSTRPNCKGVVTANTAEQLRTKTWAELGKWLRICITRHWFNYSSGRGSMSLVFRDTPETWRVDAQTCREENSEAFAGLHSAGSTPFYIFDEASAIPDKIYEVSEGGTTDGEPMGFQFGNPTRNTGRFFENCVGKFRHRWNVRSIDSRTVAITNKDRLNKWVEDYGEDSDFVKIRVRGDFPSAGDLQFISSDIVEQAIERQPNADSHAPLIIGVDVARFGDDQTVIYPRVGRDAQSWEVRKYRGLDTVQVAGRVIEVIKEFEVRGRECNALFVDGGGIGGGVVDQLRALGYDPREVQSASSPTDRSYANKRAEMWGNMREALANNLAIVDDRELKEDLTGLEYGFNLNNANLLEKKSEMKKRGAASPDMADALALTFAQPVAPRHMPAGMTAHGRINSEYNPFEEAHA